MTRPHVSIAGLMAAVAAVAVDVTVWRSIYASGSNSQSAFFYACGVLPLASLLIMVGLFSLPGLLREGRLSPFVFGFEAVGWVVVFAFISWYSIAEHAVIGYASAIAAPIRPLIFSYFETAPDWAKFCGEFGFATVLFSLPQLLLALLGGWAAGYYGFSARFEQTGTPSSLPEPEATRETTVPDPLSQKTRQVAGGFE